MILQSKWKNISNLEQFNNCLGILDLLRIDFVYNEEHTYASFLFMQLLLVCPNSKEIDDFLYKNNYYCIVLPYMILSSILLKDF